MAGIRSWNSLVDPASIPRQQKALARSTQGWATPCLSSTPAMAAVGFTRAGGAASSTPHQGACGEAFADAREEWLVGHFFAMLIHANNGVL